VNVSMTVEGMDRSFIARLTAAPVDDMAPNATVLACFSACAISSTSPFVCTLQPVASVCAQRLREVVNQVCRPAAAVARHCLLGESLIKIHRNHNGVREAVPVALESGKQVQILPTCRSCAQSHALGSHQN